MALMKLQNVELAYGSRCVLKNINLEVGAGKLVALMGPNGSGKSTLLNAVMREMKLNKGSVEIEGKDIGEYSLKALSEKISIVQTHLPDLGYMRVKELIALGRYQNSSWTGKLNDADLEIISRTLSEMGIEKLADRFIHELSDGERQKTIISRALVQDTEIILMDEPTAFIDPVASLEILALLKKQCESYNKTIVFSSHDIGSAFQFADQIWLIRRDGAVTSGTSVALRDNGSLELAFGKEGFRLSHGVVGFEIND